MNHKYLHMGSIHVSAVIFPTVAAKKSYLCVYLIDLFRLTLIYLDQ